MGEAKYIHTSKVKPYVVPRDVSVDPAYMQRATRFGSNPTIPMEDEFELGTKGAVAFNKKMMEVSAALDVKEYGRIDLWALLANKSVSSNMEVKLTDLEQAEVDLVVPAVNNDGKKITDYLPRAVVLSFGLTVPVDDKLVQAWGFGQITKAENLTNNNQDFIVEAHTITGDEATAGSFDLNGTPVKISESRYDCYFLRAVKVHSGTQTDLVEGTDFTTADGKTIEDGSNNFVEGDEWVFHFTAGSGMETYVRDTSIPDYMPDRNVECVLINETDPYNPEENKLLRLQSSGFTATLNSEILKEIGNKDKVSRVPTFNEVSIDIGKSSSDITTLARFCGANPDTVGLLSIKDVIDNLVYEIRIYDNAEHTGGVKLRYRIEGLTIPAATKEAPVDSFMTGGFTVRSVDQNCLLIRNY